MVLRNNVFKIILVVFSVFLFISCNSSKEKVSVTESKANTSPQAVRKFFNYNGYRYALSEFVPKELTKSELLGEIKHEMVLGDSTYLKSDFAGTYGVGGKIYEIKEYNKDFRVLLEYEGKYYMAENVGNVSEDKKNIAEYFKKADIINKLNSVALFNPQGQKKIKDIKKEVFNDMLKEIEKSSTKNLTDQDYETLSAAQVNGDFYLIRATFEDGTLFNMYILPKDGFVSVGDDTYILSPDFYEKFNNIFK